MIEYLENIYNNITFIGEEHPIESHRVRNSNIISLQIEHPFLNDVLQNIKQKLIISKQNNENGPLSMFNIGSGIYIHYFNITQNNDIIKYPFEKKNLLTFHSIIYSKNIKKWQDTYQLLFK